MRRHCRQDLQNDSTEMRRRERVLPSLSCTCARWRCVIVCCSFTFSAIRDSWCSRLVSVSEAHHLAGCARASIGMAAQWFRCARRRFCVLGARRPSCRASCRGAPVLCSIPLLSLGSSPAAHSARESPRRNTVPAHSASTSAARAASRRVDNVFLAECVARRL